jgi:hypothetical protein
VSMAMHVTEPRAVATGSKFHVRQVHAGSGRYRDCVKTMIMPRARTVVSDVGCYRRGLTFPERCHPLAGWRLTLSADSLAIQRETPTGQARGIF